MSCENHVFYCKVIEGVKGISQMDINGMKLKLSMSEKSPQELLSYIFGLKIIIGKFSFKSVHSI